MANLANEFFAVVARFDSPLIGAIAPALFSGAVLFAFLQWVPSTTRFARAGLAIVSVALMGRYLVWRYTATLAGPGELLSWLAGIVFISIETGALISSAISMLFLSRVRDRSAEADAHAGWIGRFPHAPLIDVFICTYNEEERLLERTIVGALGMDYPNFRIWVLDDGKRAWLENLCGVLGCRYLARPDNQHAKAGNINHAAAHVAALPHPPDFISVLDADFVPTAKFLSRAMALFHDSSVGIVQTPQHFINPDPIQTNLSLSGTWPDEQRYFFDIVLPAKDAWSCAFCCGTSSIIRFSALQKLGGIPTDSVTEDYLLTLRLKEIGYTTAYLNEPLTFGLAPEGLREYVVQRGRWCLGFMQIVRGPSGPFSLKRRIRFVERLSLLEAFLNWTFVYLYKLAGIIVPALYLLFGIRAIEASLIDLLRFFLPFYVVQSLTMSWISRGRIVPIITDVSQALTAPPALKSAFLGLLYPRKQKFNVTAKGGDRTVRFVEWPLLRIFAPLLGLSVLSVLVGFTFSDRHLPADQAGLALIWSWYNIASLIVLCLLCIEQPRRRRAGRFPSDDTVAIFLGGERRVFRMRDISVGGAHLEGDAPAGLGARVVLRIGKSHLPAAIVRISRNGFGVRFESSLKARIATVRHIYSATHDRAIRRVRTAPIVKAIFQRLMK